MRDEDESDLKKQVEETSRRVTLLEEALRQVNEHVLRLVNYVAPRPSFSDLLPNTVRRCAVCQMLTKNWVACPVPRCSFEALACACVTTVPGATFARDARLTLHLATEHPEWDGKTA